MKAAVVSLAQTFLRFSLSVAVLASIGVLSIGVLSGVPAAGVPAAGLPQTASKLSQAPIQSPSAPGDLLLVREWDNRTGELTGWLTSYNTAIKLQLLDNESPPDLRYNDATTMVWLGHDGDKDDRTVRTESKPVRVNGVDMVPVDKAANIVMIGKRHFLIREIIFGGVRWMRPRTATGEIRSAELPTAELPTAPSTSGQPSDSHPAAAPPK